MKPFAIAETGLIDRDPDLNPCVAPEQQASRPPVENSKRIWLRPRRVSALVFGAASFGRAKPPTGPASKWRSHQIFF
jgi:hypothetical protein